MEAKEYLDLLRDDGAVLRLAHFDGEYCDGRGNAAVIDEEHSIAVMLQDCGDTDRTLVKAGAIVKFSKHPEAEPRIIGTPAYSHPVVLAGVKYR